MKQIYDYKNPEPKYACARGDKFLYELLRYRDHILENKTDGNFIPPVLMERYSESSEEPAKKSRFSGFLKALVS